MSNLVFVAPAQKRLATQAQKIAEDFVSAKSMEGGRVIPEETLLVGHKLPYLIGVE